MSESEDTGEQDFLDRRAGEARADLERRLAPEPPPLDAGRLRVRHEHRRIAVLAAAIVAVALVAGALVTRDDSRPTANPTTPLAAKLVRSDKPRTAGDTSAIPTAVQADTAFAADLYRTAARTAKGNFFLSPHSISMALAMTLAGADGRTRAQMQKVMHIGVPEPAFHDAINALDQSLTAPRSRTPSQSGGQPLRLTTANSLWGQAGYPFRQQFLDRIAQSYAAGMNVVDFVHKAEGSRAAINLWVRQHTDGKITELIPSGVIDDLTRLVLVNAITFQASWVTKFDQATPGTFTTAAGTKVTTPMMSGGKGTYASGEGWKAAAIPYIGGAHLVVIVPDNLASFEPRVTAQLLEDAATGDERAAVTLPKFSIDFTLGLKPTLTALGMTDAFDPDHADLSRINGRKCPDPRCLDVSAVVHKATIRIDEKGTEAAAATAVVVAIPTSATPTHELVVNKPYLFAIRDDATGATLFSGRVTNPAA